MRDIYSETEVYHTLNVLGKGTFGEVSKCWRGCDGELVAVKIMKIDALWDRVIKNELKLLGALSLSNLRTSHIVQFHEAFRDPTHYHLVFELLEKNLLQLQKENGLKPMAVRHIRTIICQMIKALVKLKELSIIHADIKPENIMLVDHNRHPFRVKLIDFGSASIFSEVRYIKEPYIQSRYYRAPEILLGLPFCEKVDMWSLGCVMAELFLAWPLYPGKSELDQVRYICDMQGLPQAHLLNMASKAHNFFKLTTNNRGENTWQLRTHKRPLRTEGPNQGMQHGMRDCRKYVLSSLDQLENMEFTEHDPELCNEDATAEFVDRRSMVQLLKRMLSMDPHQRIQPTAAAYHPFINMHHLSPDYNLYRQKSVQAVRAALIQDLAPGTDSVRPHYSSAAGGFYRGAGSPLQSCPQGQNLLSQSGGHALSSVGYQGNCGVLVWQGPVLGRPNPSTELTEGLMDMCLKEEFSLGSNMEVWAEGGTQHGSQALGSMVPSYLPTSLQSSERNTFQETGWSNEEPDFGSALDCFTRLCESQHFRQPAARSSGSDHTQALNSPFGSTMKNPGDTKGSYHRDIQDDNPGHRKKADASRYYEGLEESQFLHLEPEGYFSPCGQLWPAVSGDLDVASLGYGAPACCSHQPHTSHLDATAPGGSLSSLDVPGLYNGGGSPTAPVSPCDPASHYLSL
ncbi:hypothetical protein UPYG_G00195580 [Umbra pygmaea]|uniref:Protein kinase domain-containing protein n=1 Tax=Umbra pygmaea TaxID=75934 RepID=A0ABD0X1A7_UMBPY